MCVTSKDKGQNEYAKEEIILKVKLPSKNDPKERESFYVLRTMSLNGCVPRMKQEEVSQKATGPFSTKAPEGP